MTPSQFQQAVLAWFDAHGRTDLPWQQQVSPYRVWLSEIMLQQTQVATVIPYFQRFTQRFPDIQSLADVALDDVLHLWTGLGYYARARNLHKTAQIIIHDFAGEFPNNIEQLSGLPGIGRSTAGAICALAFHQKAAILDGNVKRVLSRFAAVEGWPGQAATHKTLWHLAEKFTPDQRIADYTQATMDLGATLCTRRSPQCPGCPLRGHCVAFREGNPEKYPGRRPAKALPVKRIRFLIIRNEMGDVLLRQNPPKGIWGSLWAFPDCGDDTAPEQACEQLGLQPDSKKFLATRRHTFSHFHLDYEPVLLDARSGGKVNEGAAQVWYNRNNPLSLGLPAPVKTLIEELQRGN